ncbi:hypothetical protein [Flavobacterium rhizosphaerae]|uniref:Uncharacterized protein n=1 Tax=Flavobacterium rhizosphaerae TaxID=3163298 RepID=A0ABW8YUN6_9FLAO
MKKYDFRHIAFHVLVALYFIWLLVFALLLAMFLSNTFGGGDIRLEKIFMTWIFVNIIMGSAVFIVIQLFKNNGLLNRVIRFTYIGTVVASVSIILATMVK